MSATDTAAMASNGDSAIRSSIVIGSHFILRCQFSIPRYLAGERGLRFLPKNGEWRIALIVYLLPVCPDLADHPCIRLAASASRVLNWRLSLSTSANPIATSAAAILRIKRYI